ncbi:MAG TPA: DUF1801 domain-containing protein [Bryobacteraceae bacterium]|nr:DUF1801 domain-containing protein [Bryobacteraceae bacterium]
MAQIKTTENDASVDRFVRALPSADVREDCRALIDIMSSVTGHPAKMWGTSIIGFDKYSYPYANGKMGEICLVGFSPRKQNLVLYITGDHERNADLLAKLGDIQTGKSCIYVKSVADLHVPALKQLIRRAMKARKNSSTPNA